jgi:hypothetical protein
VKALVKELLLSSTIGRAAYGRAQEAWFENRYRQHRERYWEAAHGDPAALSPAAAVQRARARIAARGYHPQRRSPGDVHTFAFVPSSWQHQNQISHGLAKVGAVTRFDYVARGFALSGLRSRVAGARERRRALQEQMLAELRRAHRERPVDWFFSYAVGWDMDSATLRVIEQELGIPRVNLSLDDKNWWFEIERGDKEGGLVNLAPHYDLCWTSAREVIGWYWAEGGQALFLPEGVNTDWFCGLALDRDIDVGFIGSNFGYRPEILETLRRAGIGVRVHGSGWPGGALDDEEMRRFFSRCRINLGLGDMHYSRWLTNLKGRDFEVPSTGRGLYLTTYNSDLAACFHVGKEIQCYRGVDELIELVRRHLSNPEELAAMAALGRARCEAQHQWRHRFETILRALGILG